jgi:molybdate transport system substrate-binding protein
MANKIKIIAAGACRIAVLETTKSFTQATEIDTEIEFMTAPAMREKIVGSSHGFDAVIGADAVTKSFIESGLMKPETTVTLGAIASSIVVRDGVAHPNIATVDDFCATIRDASAVIYNVASSGIYIEKLMETLGLADEIAGRTERAPTGAALLERIAAGKGDKEIGFGQMTEILRVKNSGVKVDLVGPLPAEIGNMTTFIASAFVNAQSPEEAERFVSFIGTKEARRLIHKAGLS